MRNRYFVSIFLVAAVVGCGPAEKVPTVAELVQETTEGDKDKQVTVRGKVLLFFIESERETFTLEGGFQTEPFLVGPKRITVFLGGEKDELNPDDRIEKPTVRFDIQEQPGQGGIYRTPNQIHRGSMITVRGRIGEKGKKTPLVVLRDVTLD